MHNFISCWRKHLSSRKYPNLLAVVQLWVVSIVGPRHGFVIVLIFLQTILTHCTECFVWRLKLYNNYEINQLGFCLQADAIVQLVCNIYWVQCSNFMLVLFAFLFCHTCIFVRHIRTHCKEYDNTLFDHKRYYVSFVRQPQFPDMTYHSTKEVWQMMNI